MDQNPLLIWITGLSGSGKTSIGRELHRLWRPLRPNLALFDGDDLRALLSPELGYSDEHRRENARRISKLCCYVVRQGVSVICPTMSLYHEIQDGNRAALKSNYVEIYVHCAVEELMRRDAKGLYAAARTGTRSDVVGINLPFEKPKNPDMVLDTTASSDAAARAGEIFNFIRERS